MLEKPTVKIERIPIQNHNIIYLTISGALHYAYPVDLKAIVDDILDEHTIGVVLDLEKVELIDSSALGVMAGLTTRLASKGAFLVLVALQQKLFGVFENSGMRDMFLMLDDRQQALGYFSKKVGNDV